jgi:hypothetical protein
MERYYFGLIIIITLLGTINFVPYALADVSITLSDTLHLTDILRAFCTFCIPTGNIAPRTDVSADQALVDAGVSQAVSALAFIMPGMLIVGIITYAGHRLGAHDRVLVILFLLAMTAVSMIPPPNTIFPPWVAVFTVIGLIVMFLYGRNKQPSGNIGPS